MNTQTMGMIRWFLLAGAVLGLWSGLIVVQPTQAQTLTEVVTSAVVNVSAQPAIPPLVAADIPEETRQGLVTAYGQLPLTFEANRGQTNSRVTFLSRGNGYTLFLTDNEAVLSLCRPPAQEGDATTPTDVVRLRLLGANPDPRVTGVDEQPGRSNYFIGNDPAQWQTGIPHVGSVHYHQVYPGIDLIYYGTDQRRLEYDFIVAPGADPTIIRLQFAGVDSLRLDREGNLIVQTSGGEVVVQVPVAYQEVEGARRAVVSRYVLTTSPSRIAERESPVVGVSVGRYDPAYPLVIDPVLTYATYVGGSGTDIGSAIAVDGAGNAYITGYTGSANFPTVNPLQASHGGGSYDVFVVKLNATGSALSYATYVGGSGGESGHDIAVDGAGNAHITGYTRSVDFPTVNPLQASFGGGSHDAFVVKLNATGSALNYATYLGGSGGSEAGDGIKMDGTGNAYITGHTQSVDFPTVNPLQASFGGAVDAFVVKLNATGSALNYATYVGGSSSDYGHDIAVDGAGNAYLIGETGSSNFPTATPLQASFGGGGADVFIAKISIDPLLQLSTTTVSAGTVNKGSSGTATFTVTNSGAGTLSVSNITSSNGQFTVSPTNFNLTGGASQLVR